MAGSGQEDFEGLARRYWGAWGDAMRTAMPGAAPSPGAAGAQAWHDAVDWWTQAAYGKRSEVNDVLGRFNTQARQWFGQMQQVAAQFSGQDAGAGEIARAWKQALGAAGENPFPEMFRGMRGHGLGGLEQWVEDAKPYLGSFHDESARWLQLPQFGFAREHQERMQGMAAAQMELQQQTSAYNALMLKASQSAYEIFESKLAEREEPGRQIDSPRALFDLWIDAAEQAYAQIALSSEFREVYGSLVNAQMRLRAAVQREAEQASALLGMPTRSELDGAHRKIVELERAMRRLRDSAPAAATPAGPASKAAPARKAKVKSKAKPASGSTRTGTASAASGKHAGKEEARVKQAPTSRPKQTRKQPKPGTTRARAPGPSVRKAPTNGFSSLIPLAPLPMSPDKGECAGKGKR
ncbi:class III poly(R)-hydroxyalkanoic acid synthase subunit PhaE [soil metagenome]